MRDALLADRRPEVRARAVLNSRIIAPLPLTVADDLDHRVTLAAARRTRDPRLLHRLGRSDELMTRQAVLANPATATATRDAMGRSLDPRLAEVLSDPTRIDRAEHVSLARVTTDDRVLELLSHDRRDEVRRAVVANPATPHSVVERIASGSGDVPDFARRILRAERDESGAVSLEHHLGDLLG